jgi:hypothetical protein
MDYVFLVVMVGSAAVAVWMYTPGTVTEDVAVVVDRDPQVVAVLNASDTVHGDASGVFDPFWTGAGLNVSVDRSEPVYVFRVAGWQRRERILPTCAHELRHVWYAQEETPSLSTEEQHHRMEENGFDGPWSYRVDVRCLRLVPHIF